MKQYDDSCAEIENSLPLYVGLDLEEAAMSEVARHLERCSTCAERERDARAARDVLVSTLVSSQRQGPDLWPGVRAGLVRDGVLAPRSPATPSKEAAALTPSVQGPSHSSPFAQTFRAAPRAQKRVRPWHFAAAAAALALSFWIARDAFRTGAPYGPGPSPNDNIVENLEPAPPRVFETSPVAVPVTRNVLAENSEALRRVGPLDRPLREGAEIYSDLPLDTGLDTLGERTSTPVILRH